MHNLRLTCRKRDSSIWTTALGPLVINHVEHTSQSRHQLLFSAAYSAASPAGYTLAQKYIRMNHMSCSVSLDLAKDQLLQCGHHRLTLSETSLLLLSTIVTAHLSVT